MKELKIYLAGKMSGLTLEEMNEWRTKLKELLMTCATYTDVKVDVVNPVDFYNFEEKRHQTEEEVEDFDLRQVTSSDIVVVNLDGLDSSVGTVIELHDAKYHNRIPVVAFGDKNLYDNLHPWIKNDITRVEDSICNVATYIQDFYLR